MHKIYGRIRAKYWWIFVNKKVNINNVDVNFTVNTVIKIEKTDIKKVSEEENETDYVIIKEGHSNFGEIGNLIVKYEVVPSVTTTILNEQIVKEYTVIINCSPIGTYPNIDESPNIPYEFISDRHLLFDLIYNPSETKFLQLGKKNGAVIKNGLEMLELQAEKSWEIWNS